MYLARALAFLVPCALCLGCTPQAASPLTGGLEPTGGLQLRVTESGKQTPRHVGVTATVINGTDYPIVWDREFSVGVRWSVESFGGSFEQVLVGEAAKPAPAEGRLRFVTLNPGESLSHDFELTYLIRVSKAEGVSIIRRDGRCYGRGSYREQLVRYDFSGSLNKIVLRLDYDIVQPEAWPAFDAWFEQTAELPWPATRISTDITISF
jgi:hypothetical protein